MLFTERGSIVSILAFSLRVPVIAQEMPFQGGIDFPSLAPFPNACFKQKCGHFLMNLLSWSISRVLSWTIIPLGDKLLCRSSNLPELWTGHPLSSYLVLLRVEFTLLPTVTGGTVRSYHTLSPLPDPLRAIGGLLSVALVVGSRRPDVIRHSALCSSDFPLVYLSH